eukprot:Amastigsp_a345642_37.p2 type:complete len:144 gc:universal Amastigsp_a345642_37:548-117(-)
MKRVVYLRDATFLRPGATIAFLFGLNTIITGLAHWRWHQGEHATPAENFWYFAQALAGPPAMLCALGLFGFSAGGDLLVKGICLYMWGVVAVTAVAFAVEGGKHGSEYHMPFAQQSIIAVLFWSWLWWYTRRFAQLIKGMKEA